MFEIRIAVIGYVSVGKTTVINALFGEEYGEVAMKRTTAVVNSFRISRADSFGTTKMETSAQDDDVDDSIEVVTKNLSANVTLLETTMDNATYRNSDVVKEKAFDISLQEELHKMRPDTKLVVVDVPGINEAGTSSQYKDYVKDKWHTFDIVVVVMDARQGVNTEEQHDLLKFVKDNLANSKALPVIVLSNKVDDPENEEQMALLEEARSAVEKIFSVKDRKDALKRFLNPSKKKPRYGLIDASLFPAVVPISAMHAFVYRCGSRLSFEEFCKMDNDFIDKIGKDSYGRQWRRFTKQKQLEKAFQAVNEEGQRQDGVEASNFDTFVKVLKCCIGDGARQTSLIEKQVEVAIKRLKAPGPNSDLAAELLAARKTLVALGKQVNGLPPAFWVSYKRLKEGAFAEFKKNPSPRPFALPVGQLYNYMMALPALKWPEEIEKVVIAAKELVLQYAVGVVDSAKIKEMSQNDQFLVLGSMLLISSETSFNAHFGFLRLHLEAKYNKTLEPNDHRGCCPNCKATLTHGSHGTGAAYCGTCCRIYLEDRGTQYCPNCTRNHWGTRLLAWKKQGNGEETANCSVCLQSFYLHKKRADHKMKVENGKLVPTNKTAYKKDVAVTVPGSFDDPEHYAHVFWKCCQLLKQVEA